MDPVGMLRLTGVGHERLAILARLDDRPGHRALTTVGRGVRSYLLDIGQDSAAALRRGRQRKRGRAQLDELMDAGEWSRIWT